MKNLSHLFYFLIFSKLFSESISTNEVANGIIYQNIKLENPVQSIHLLKIDPNKANIIIGIADNKCASAKKTSDLAKMNNAIAAINAGFFDFGKKNKLTNLITLALDAIGYDNYKAFPIYLLKINDIYSASHILTGALAWSKKDNNFHFDKLILKTKLRINNIDLPIADFNKPYAKGPILYSSVYDEKTPKRNQNCTEIIIKNNKIKKILLKSRGNTEIEKGNYVYYTPKNLKNLNLKIDDDAIINFDYLDENNKPFNVDWNRYDYILASTPILIQDGKLNEKLNSYKSDYYSKRHPRTAIGLTNDGKLLLLVIDGRQKFSTGFTMPELSKFMLDNDCKHALNLDGGGSSTMIIQNKIVNSPSGREWGLSKKERPISNAILVLPK